MVTGDRTLILSPESNNIESIYIGGKKVAKILKDGKCIYSTDDMSDYELVFNYDNISCPPDEDVSIARSVLGSYNYADVSWKLHGEVQLPKKRDNLDIYLENPRDKTPQFIEIKVVNTGFDNVLTMMQIIEWFDNKTKSNFYSNGNNSQLDSEWCPFSIEKDGTNLIVHFGGYEAEISLDDSDNFFTYPDLDISVYSSNDSVVFRNLKFYRKIPPWNLSFKTNFTDGSSPSPVQNSANVYIEYDEIVVDGQGRHIPDDMVSLSVENNWSNTFETPYTPMEFTVESIEGYTQGDYSVNGEVVKAGAMMNLPILVNGHNVEVIFYFRINNPIPPK